MKVLNAAARLTWLSLAVLAQKLPESQSDDSSSSSFSSTGPESPSFAPGGPNLPSFAPNGPDSPSFSPGQQTAVLAQNLPENPETTSTPSNTTSNLPSPQTALESTELYGLTLTPNWNSTTPEFGPGLTTDFVDSNTYSPNMLPDYAESDDSSSPSFSSNGPESPSFAPGGPKLPSFAPNGPDSPSLAPGGPNAPAFAPPVWVRGRNHDQGWMAKLSSSVKKRKLSKITIPSTHDSAMYSTRKDLPLAQNAASFMFGFAIDIASNYAITQSSNIYDQLEMGVRMLDLRIMPLLHSRTSLWIAHSLYSHSLESVFADINRFSDNYGPKEIIIINIHQIYDFQEKEIKELNRLITKYFASKVALKDSYDDEPGAYSLAHYQSTNKPILIFLGSHNKAPQFLGKRDIMSHSDLMHNWNYFKKSQNLNDLWPQVDTGTHNIEKALKTKGDQYSRYPDRLLEYQYIFTPTGGSIATDRLTLKYSLKDASNVIPKKFKEWISRFNHGDGLNFVALDFMTKEAARDIIAVNNRRCDAIFYDMNRKLHRCIETDTVFRLSDVGSSPGYKMIEESSRVCVKPGYILKLYGAINYRGCMKKYDNVRGRDEACHNLPNRCLSNNVDSLYLVKHVSNRGAFFYRGSREIGFIDYNEMPIWISDIGKSHLHSIEPSTHVLLGPRSKVTLYENPGFRGCKRMFNNCGGSWKRFDLPKGCVYNDVDALSAKRC